MVKWLLSFDEEALAFSAKGGGSRHRRRRTRAHPGGTHLFDMGPKTPHRTVGKPPGSQNDLLMPADSLG